MDALAELIFAEGLRSVVVKDSELAAKGLDRSATSLSKLFPEVVYKAFDFHGALFNLKFVLAPLDGLVLSLLLSPALLVNHGAIEVPGVVHHELEIGIIVDGGGHVVVVLVKLVPGHDVIGGLLLSNRVGDLKGLEEFLEHLILSLLSSDDIGVLVGEVVLADVGNIDET